MSSVKFDSAEISLLEKNLIHTVYEDNCLLNNKHLEDIRDVYTKLHGHEDLKDLKLLVEFKGDINISKNLSEGGIFRRIRRKTAEAFVSPSAQTREYLKGAKAIILTEHPIEVFDTVGEAMKWLRRF
ncbi:hypothetical protein K6119_01675 [Paracrocinitomix mangrovi]|uniref:hypothetical protein n=1 Tax=Paracrocinitomix mangrovi TaxID=2862509 RepID=UPI001C8D1638|nr:hypothetical protein [Paracrocinitomix mangrovi]UKN02226.1 hypothetical protein K6119_01675 [Paracrocinitomix mangrovi]